MDEGCALRTLSGALAHLKAELGKVVWARLQLGCQALERQSGRVCIGSRDDRASRARRCAKAPKTVRWTLLAAMRAGGPPRTRNPETPSAPRDNGSYPQRTLTANRDVRTAALDWRIVTGAAGDKAHLIEMAGACPSGSAAGDATSHRLRVCAALDTGAAVPDPPSAGNVS